MALIGQHKHGALHVSDVHDLQRRLDEEAAARQEQHARTLRRFLGLLDEERAERSAAVEALQTRLEELAPLVPLAALQACRAASGPDLEVPESSRLAFAGLQRALLERALQERTLEECSLHERGLGEPPGDAQVLREALGAPQAPDGATSLRLATLDEGLRECSEEVAHWRTHCHEYAAETASKIASLEARHAPREPSFVGPSQQVAHTQARFGSPFQRHESSELSASQSGSCVAVDQKQNSVDLGVRVDALEASLLQQMQEHADTLRAFERKLDGGQTLGGSLHSDRWSPNVATSTVSAVADAQAIRDKLRRRFGLPLEATGLVSPALA